MATFYTAHQPDADGVIHYSNEEHGTWQILIERQLAAL
ncbi:MAG: phenylalanine 4-monooxygenase, partial [Aeromonas veronii]